MNRLENRRVLLVDDTPAIHEDFRKVLGGSARDSSLAEDEAILFGTSAPQQTIPFDLASAFQGREALEKVKAARDGQLPYAMAFVDIRMPPGWDGVETAQRLWEEDPQLQIVLCTAYSDYSWPEILARLDVRDRLLILKKPFDPIEVYQFANALTTKWKLSEQAAFKMSRLEEAVEQRTQELSNANIIVQSSPVVLYRLKGEPSFPLIYVSHNITKFGHEPAKLLTDAEWAKKLIHPEDRVKVGETMARVFEKNAQGAALEFRLLTASGASRWVENRYVPVRDADGLLVEIEGILIDITERKLAEEKIAQLARTDSLTGLANRATFMERLNQAFAAARRGALPFAVLYLDLDQFKPVNDTLGHSAGDIVLQQVAQRLRACTRESDLIARLGGDEFAILQGELRETANAGELAAKIHESLREPYELMGDEIRISVSIGICPYSPELDQSDAMLAHADRALYRSKEQGRDQYHFHSSQLDREVRERVTLAAELRQALERAELSVDYQPQVELSSRKIVGMEALVRWDHPSRGRLAAATFIPVAEKSGMVVALGRWVLKQACRQMKEWRSEGIAPEVVAINLSLAQLKRGAELIAEVQAALVEYGLPPSDLEFDVTEGTLAQLKWTQNEVLPKLRELGVHIAIDDFGSEYSSFDYVKAYGVSHLKIARSYISRSDTDTQTAATVAAIVNYARDVGIGVIAQGVETPQQDALLQSAGPDARGQGFHFSAAVPATEAAKLLRQGTV